MSISLPIDATHCPSRIADVPHGVEREHRPSGTTRAEQPTDPTTCAAIRRSISSVPQPRTTSDAVIEAAALGMLRSGGSWLPKTGGAAPVARRRTRPPAAIAR
jgi:hypothetical protein